MNIRYSSVDRAKELRSRKKLNPFHLGGSIILKGKDFDINKFLFQTNQSSTSTLAPKKIYPKKLPSLNRKVLNPLFDLNSKNSDNSTEANNGFSFERDNSEKNNFNILENELNKERNKSNYYIQIINSNFNEKPSINNTDSSFTLNFHNQNIKQKKVSHLFKKYPNERLYPKKSITSINNNINFIKVIKEIKNNNEKIRQEDRNADYFKKMPAYKSKIAYDSRYENVVFDANYEINKYRDRENDLTIKENIIKNFIIKNKQISKNNVLLEVMKKRNKILEKENEERSKDIEELKKTIKDDEKEFDNYTNQQRDLYFKVAEIAQTFHHENNNLRKLVHDYETRTKSLEDEIFKLIEQIESLTIYAKFVHKVLGGDEELFDMKIIPNYEDDIRPDIKLLVNKVYEKYGNLLKNNKSKINNNNANNNSNNSNNDSIINEDKEQKSKNEDNDNINNNENINDNNSNKSDNNNENGNNIDNENNNINDIKELRLNDDKVKEIKEDIDEEDDFLSDPYLIIRKFKELENKILRIVEKRENFDKNYINELEENRETIKYMKKRIVALTKEYEQEKKALINFKNNEFGNNTHGMSEEEFCIMANDLCKIIDNRDNKKKKIEEINQNKKKKNNHMNDIEILELGDKMIKCLNIMINKEKIINTYMSKIENYEIEDPKMVNTIINKRKKENTITNQNNLRKDMEEIEFKKKMESEERLHKIILKFKKSEAPLYLKKKEDKVKVDPKEIIDNENQELLMYD